jgi:hypothetical protein
MSELRTRAQPVLRRAGFQVFGREKNEKFSPRYWRRRGGSIDLIEFQWSKYQRPQFIINFNSLPADSKALLNSSDKSKVWAWDSSYRASRAQDREKWFGIGFGSRLLGSRRRYAAEIDATIDRIADIDRFLIEGRKSPYLLELASVARHPT